MKIIYDPEVDALTIILSEGKALESEEIFPNIIIDFSEKGEVISIEVLHAKKTLKEVKNLDKLLAFKT